MVIECIINGRWQENCYLVYENKSTLVIDPGSNIEQIIKNLDENNVCEVLAIINTHAHFDHLGASADLIDKYKCPFYLHSKDLRLLRTANLYMKLFSGERPIRIPSVDFMFDKVSCPIVFGDISVDVIYSPGHTEGSVCFLIGDSLFTGDTLLKGKIGRVDLPGGDKEKLKVSLRNITNLSKELKIYPGHGLSTTLGEELLSNDSFIKSLK
jgi:hydroxyacylglutathione hydrolase